MWYIQYTDDRGHFVTETYKSAHEWIERDSHLLFLGFSTSAWEE